MSRGEVVSEVRGAGSRGGKSELRRAVRRLTTGQGDLKESGTENIPPSLRRLSAKGGSAPRGVEPLQTQLLQGSYVAPLAAWPLSRRGDGKGEKVR